MRVLPRQPWLFLMLATAMVLAAPLPSALAAAPAPVAGQVPPVPGPAGPTVDPLLKQAQDTSGAAVQRAAGVVNQAQKAVTRIDRAPAAPGTRRPARLSLPPPERVPVWARPDRPAAGAMGGPAARRAVASPRDQAPASSPRETRKAQRTGPSLGRHHASPAGKQTPERAPDNGTSVGGLSSARNAGLLGLALLGAFALSLLRAASPRLGLR